MHSDHLNLNYKSKVGITMEFYKNEICKAINSLTDLRLLEKIYFLVLYIKNERD